MERQEELVAAAYGLVATRGFEGLRTRDVAGVVGLNVATLHYYYPTKEALIRGVVGHAMARFRSTLSPAGSPGEQLRAHLGGLRPLARGEPEPRGLIGAHALRARRARPGAADGRWSAAIRHA